MLFDDRAILVIRCGHSDTEFLRFISARNDTTIVIAQHNNGFVVEVGPEEPFARTIKTVTVDDGFHSE
jgi:hypothetical protein